MADNGRPRLSQGDDVRRDEALATSDQTYLRPTHRPDPGMDYDTFVLPPLTTAQRIAVSVALVVVALVSFFPLGTYFSSPETYAATIAALDDKLSTVLSLIAGSTGSSAAVTLLPGDLGTPIAEKLVDLSSDFLIVISAIYLEKYLLTILGFVAFKILVPVGLLMLVGALNLSWPIVKSWFFGLGTKLTVFGLAIAFVVPTSVWVSSMIEATYQESINSTLTQATETAEQIEDEVESEKTEEAPSNPVASIVSSITGQAAQLTESARQSLNRFIEALAVMIVTSCVIPILVLLFFLWLVKIILGIDVRLPMPRTPRSFTHRR